MTDLEIRVDFGALPRRVKDDPSGFVTEIQRNAVAAGAPYLQAEMTRKVPIGATAKLSQSIGIDTSFDGTSAFIGPTGAPSIYAPFVHDGTRPHWPPIAPLTYWAARVLGDPRAGYAVARAISRRGTKPQPFVEETVRDAYGRTIRLMSDAVRRTIREVA